MLTKQFTHQGSGARIIFGSGSSATLGHWVDWLGCSRALVLCTPHQADQAGAMLRQLGEQGAGLFAGAVMHTPIEVTEVAMDTVREVRADCLVSLGGGSTTGLGKAIAYRTDLPQIVVPTTYAGSEVTPILGQTEKGLKTTLRDARILPEVVIYDPALTVGLPVGMSVTSGINAMAHAAEALYAENRSPVWTLLATEGLRAMKSALPQIVAQPHDPDARAEALYGAWLCGTVLGALDMALHHKLCHTLGGSFNLPHAETHSVMLPHSIGYNARAAPDLLRPLGELFGGSPGSSLHDFAASLRAPMTLRELGMREVDLDRAALLATEKPYPNPRPIDVRSIRRLLQDAWEGHRPRD